MQDWRKTGSSFTNPIPITGPDKSAASPLRPSLLVSTGSEMSGTHPERPAAVDAGLLGEHHLARFVMFALGRGWFDEKFAPGLF